MNDQTSAQAVSQKIFQMGLSVETVSVYLLCCGLAESGTPLSLKNLSNIWNGTPGQLQDGLKNLENRKVLRKIIAGSDDNAVYQIQDPDRWQCH